MANNKYCTIGRRCQDGRIRNREKRWGVNDYDIEPCRKELEQRRHALRPEQLRRIRWNRTGRQYHHQAAIPSHENFVELVLPGQQTR
jgi:hypothetical protein